MQVYRKIGKIRALFGISMSYLPFCPEKGRVVIKKTEAILALLVILHILGIEKTAYLQPNTARGNIPSHIPAQLRQQIERLYSRVPVERADAAVRLGQMGEKAVPAIPFLVGMLGDSTQSVSEAGDVATSPGVEAASALVRIGRPAVEALVAVLMDEDSSIQGHAVWALGEIKDRRAVEPLIALLKDKDPFVSGKAAWALGEIKDRRGVEPLIAALNHKQWSVRTTAAEALGKIGDRRGVEPLIAAMEDEEGRVRLDAAVALGEMRDPRVVEPLIAALKDESRDVRSRAAEALRKITGKDFGKDSDRWHEWWEENRETAFDCCT
jgi:HEAT repeat protein